MIFKKYAKLGCSILFLLLTACSTIPQPTMEELLAEVNAEHQAIKAKVVDFSPYMKENPKQEEIDKYRQKNEVYDPDKSLTKQQAIEDVSFLFDAFHDCYGPYEYFGGAKVFDIAEEKIKKELKTKETLTAADLEKILLENLKFIEDGHFKINMENSNPTKIPFFFREVAFIKTENGYQTTDGKKVQSIEGYDNLDELMKRSISPDGELVYYPVLLKDCGMLEALLSPQNCDEVLTVHYTNGKEQELTAEPYQVYTEFDLENPKNTPITEFDKNGNIPVFQINSFKKEKMEETLKEAKKLKDEPVVILDLRSNAGGDGKIVEMWLNEYVGQTVPANTTSINTCSEERLYSSRDRWIERDNLLIILMGKYTASASEIFIDCSHNLENVLFIGENTNGALRSGAGEMYLPNSQCRVNIGEGTLSVFPENCNFEELRGFYPDIWVPAEEAEQAVIRMLKKQNMGI